MENDISSLTKRIEQLETRLSIECDRALKFDTQLQSTLNAVKTVYESQKKIHETRHLYHELNRKVNAIACCVVGAVLIWQSSSMQLDSAVGNDRLGEWMAIAGLVIVSFGILVLTGKEDRVITILQSMNPWRKHD